MIDSIDYLIAKSGDSELLESSYVCGVLTFSLNVEELDCVVKFELRTPVVASSLKGGGVAHTACHLELLLLEEHLILGNGVYVPATDFGTMMKQKRAHLHLAYGLRISEAKILLRVVGHSILLACPVQDLDQIHWEVVESL